MKKYLILPAIMLLVKTAPCSAAISKPVKHRSLYQADSLSAYVGKYQGQQGMQTIYAEIFIDHGKLTAKSSDGSVLVFDHLSGDNFVIVHQGVPIKFIRNGENKVSQVMVNGKIAWSKTDGKSEVTDQKQPASYSAYLGKYQITMNGQTLYLEITVKNGVLWATQLWDGGNSALNYLSEDKFNVVALSIPLKFIRDKDKNVVQILLNGSDLFTKVKS